MSIEFTPSPDELDILNQFKEVSYEAFDIALRRFTGSRMNPALDGKPVNLLRFNVERRHNATVQEFEPNPIEKEILGVCVQQPRHIPILAQHGLYATLSIEEKAQHQALVESLDDLRIGSQFSLSDHVPQEAIWSNYAALRQVQMENGISTNTSVSTYELPKSQDEFDRMYELTSALFFARDALAYLISPAFERPTRERKPTELRHFVNFVITPELSPYLNGHEPPAFLKDYQAAMQKEVSYLRGYLAKLEELSIEPDPQTLERLKQNQDALDRVNKIIADRNDK